MISGLDNALLGASSHVIPGWLMGGETHDDDSPECAVGVTVTATVEAMTTAGLSRGRRQRRHPAGTGERTL